MVFFGISTLLGRLILRQYRRVYQFDRWIREHFTMTGHLFFILLFGSGVFGVDTSATTTYQLFVFLLFIFIFSFVLNLFNRCEFTVVRQLPKYTTVGELLIYTVILSFNSKKKQHDNLAFIEQLSEPFPRYSELAEYYQCAHKPWYKRGISFQQWRKYLAYRRGGYIIEKLIPTRIGNQAIEIKVSFTPLRRGKLKFSGCYIAKPDLLNLVRRLFFQSKKQALLVLPKRYDLPPLMLAGKRKYQQGGVSLANSVGESTEFISLRDYRQGDALNNIHWKSYARHGKLIVKEYQDEYFVRRALLLDTFVGEFEAERFEAAVSVAASIAMSERQNDALLDLMFVDQQAYRFTSGRGVDHMPHLQEILASVQQSRKDEFIQLQQSVMRHAGLCSSFVCVLLHWDEQRQHLIKQLAVLEIPVAVFFIHGGKYKLEEIDHKPEHFYLIDYRHIAEDLAQI